MKSKAGDFLAKFGTVAVLLVFILLMQLIFSDLPLLSWANLMNIASQATVLSLVAFGLSIVMMCGEIDLSYVGSLGLLGTVFVLLLDSVNGLAAAMIVIGLSLAIGILNGLVISKFKYSSFLATLSMMFIMMGLQRGLTNGLAVWINDKGVLAVASMQIFSVPFPAIILVISFVIYFFFIVYTTAGFKLKVIGENIEAAKEVGIKTQRIKLWAFVFASLCFGIAGVIEPLRSSGGVIDSGWALFVPSLAACFLGTTMFEPGRVNPLGTLISAMFLSLIINFLTQIGVVYYFINLILGFLLLLAVGLSSIKNRSIKQIKI
jgi:ribose/xylose/arabinose/galactoside ABC-type transport system permease subunit